MPPIRTPGPTAAKLQIPAKTERSHEENQERAYIAASRRSDRSLEARVESARRASEIHKKRTGRSLRVTEQDVINEEMYEEEDDDLPLQYRRLTAHLQTNSSDFNRRLSAYLTSHQAMRNALSQALSNSYAQSASQMSPTTGPQASQPFNLTMPAHRQNAATSPTATGPALAQQGNYRQSPYPLHNGVYHQRSASSSNSVPSLKRESTDSTGSPQLSKHHDFDRVRQTPSNTVFPQPTGNPIWDHNMDIGPFSTSLTNDARMFLDHQTLSSQYLDTSGFSKPAAQPVVDGMSQTLAPQALDGKSPDDFTWDLSSSALADDSLAATAGFKSSFGDGSLAAVDFGAHLDTEGISPNEDMWNFIDDTAYEAT